MFEYYVQNYDINQNKIVNFNIFQNWRLEEAVEKEVKKYVRSPKKYCCEPRGYDEQKLYGFEGFVEELRRLIMWQEWSRCEYEIAIGGLPYGLRDESSKEDYEKYFNSLEKWDCYQQCLPNIEMIAREVIYQYKEAKRKVKNGEEA